MKDDDEIVDIQNHETTKYRSKDKSYELWCSIPCTGDER
jgi:hypothetical protein